MREGVGKPALRWLRTLESAMRGESIPKRIGEGDAKVGKTLNPVLLRFGNLARLGQCERAGIFSVLLTPICATARPFGADTLHALLERSLSFDRARTETIPLVLSMLTPDGVHVGEPQLRDQPAHISTAPS